MKYKIKKIILGNNEDGLLQKFLIYFFIIIIGFVFIYPIIHMLSYSFMTEKDLIDPFVSAIPTELYIENYKKAYKILDYPNALMTTIIVSVIPALIQMIMCSLFGYGLSRFNFIGKKVVFILILSTFIIPPQVTMIPQFLMYKKLNILYSLNAYILPAFFGQGIKSAIFILIFYQFFNQVPKALEEAAMIDGANNFTIFLKIYAKTALPAYLLTFLLSTVWYWNETYMASMYFGKEIQTLPIKLADFEASFSKMYSSKSGNNINEAIKMAGTCLNILPLLIIYFIVQRWFIEGIDKSGITGE